MLVSSFFRPFLLDLINLPDSMNSINTNVVLRTAFLFLFFFSFFFFFFFLRCLIFILLVRKFVNTIEQSSLITF